MQGTECITSAERESEGRVGMRVHARGISNLADGACTLTQHGFAKPRKRARKGQAEPRTLDAMLKDLARGMTEVVSEAVQIDDTAIALLAENGVGGLESGMTIKFLAAVDRVFTASRAAVLFAVSPTAEFSIDEI